MGQGALSLADCKGRAFAPRRQSRPKGVTAFYKATVGCATTQALLALTATRWQIKDLLLGAFFRGGFLSGNAMWTLPSVNVRALHMRSLISPLKGIINAFLYGQLVPQETKFLDF